MLSHSKKSSTPIFIYCKKINPEINDTQSVRTLTPIPKNAWTENAFVKKQSNETVILDPLIRRTDNVSIKLTEDYGNAEISKRKKFTSSSFLEQEHLNDKEIRGNFDCICPWWIPWFVIINISLQILFFMFTTPELYSQCLYSPYKKNEIWRFVSYSFLHSDVIHLLLNIFLQMFLGIVLEYEQGHFRVFVIYFAGVLSGSIAVSIFQPELSVVGSSAGVYSLLISHVAHTSINFERLSYRYFRTFAVIVLWSSDIISSIYYYLQSHDSQQPKISLAAHICGALTGLLLGFATFSTVCTIFYKILKFMCACIYTGVISMAVFCTYNDVQIKIII